MPRGPVLIGLCADSFVHVGIGQSFGEVDLPFVREAATQYPFVPGSALKGALRRAFWEEDPRFETDAHGQPTKATFRPGETAIFGHSDEGAGSLLVGDARLVLLPVRSLGFGFRYLTCPTLLARVLRDLGRCGRSPDETIEPFDLLVGDEVEETVLCRAGESAPVFLEEVPFKVAAEPFDDDCNAVLAHIIEALTDVSEAERKAMLERIVLVTDKAFEAFARHALPVRMRNKLDEDKLVERGALWSEEYLPPEALLYAVLADRRPASKGPDPMAELRDLIAARGGYLQIGGNETVGQGLCRLTVPAAEPDEPDESEKPS